MHLTKKKVHALIEEEEKNIERIQEDALSRVQPPEMESHKTLTVGHGCGVVAWALLALVFFVGSLFSGMSGLGLFLLITYGGIGFMVYLFMAGRKKNKEADVRNEERKQDYAMAQSMALVEAEPAVNEIKGRIDFYGREIARIEGLLQELYSANVIPRWYRDIYPAVYLDDWFSNGRSDDLDMALNTFVLETIKEKLDVIISNQAEELINQRIMIANQQKAMEQQERHHQELMDRLDTMQTTNEERNTYLRLINANTAPSAFYSRATYLGW